MFSCYSTWVPNLQFKVVFDVSDRTSGGALGDRTQW